MKANLFYPLSAVLAFIVGTALTAIISSVSNNSVQAGKEVIATTTAVESSPFIDNLEPSSHSSDLSRVASMLTQLVESKAKVGTNTFYVEFVNEEELGGEFARAYWKEDQSVIIFTPPYDAERFSLELTYARRIDLVHDVVPTEADVGTTNYLVARKWINDVLNRCVRNGVKFTITKNSKSRQSHTRSQWTRR